MTVSDAMNAFPYTVILFAGRHSMEHNREHYCTEICPLFAGQLWGCETYCDYEKDHQTWQPKPQLYRRTISQYVKRDPRENFHAYPIGMARPAPFNPFAAS
jgi:hypothetical protein